MPKFLYILYFRYHNTHLFEYYAKQADDIFSGNTVSCIALGEDCASLSVTSKRPINPQNIAHFESLFGEYLGELILSHYNTTVNKAKLDPQHVFSGGCLVKFSFWEILTLKRFFFVRNVKKLVQNSSRSTSFCYKDNFLCFFLQSDKPVLQVEADFITKTISPKCFYFFKVLA